MNNNQNRKKNKHIKKGKKVETKFKQQERTHEFQQSFVDLISYSQEVSQEQQMIAQNCQNAKMLKNEESKIILWPKLPSSVQKAESIMVVGSKNTGKSTFCSFIQQKNKDVVLLDCDIGKNASMDGCVSLIYGQWVKRIWIGQFTPVNNLETYLKAIKYLYSQYKSTWFSKRLVINTMGYATGLGEFLLYEIYQIIKPKLVFVLKHTQTNSYDPIKNIIDNISSGKYIQKLYLSKNSSDQMHVTSTKIETYQNKEAIPKKVSARFQRHFGEQNILHIVDLIQKIKESQSVFTQNKLKSTQVSDMRIFQQRKHQKQNNQALQSVMYKPINSEKCIDMRIIILGKIVQQESNSSICLDKKKHLSAKLFEVQCLGFVFEGKIYSTIQMSNLIGIVSQGIDFQKGFYHLNEKQLIDLQLKWGRMNYILVSAKGLGSKGVRNNPSKSA